MPKSGVTLPTLKKSNIAGIREMRATLSHITLSVQEAMTLKDIFMEAAEIFYYTLKDAMPARISPIRGTAKFAPDVVARNMVRGKGTPDKPNVMVGISKHEGASMVWLWNEYGTRFIKARPVFRNSLAITKQAMGNIIANGIKDTIENAANEAAVSNPQ